MKNKEKLLGLVVGFTLSVVVCSLVACLTNDEHNNATAFKVSEDYTVTFPDYDLMNEEDITEDSNGDIESEDERPCIITVLSKKDGIWNTGELIIDRNTLEGYVGLVNTNKFTEVVSLYKGTNDEKELIYQTKIKSGASLDNIKLDKLLETNQEGILSFYLITEDDKENAFEYGGLSMFVDIIVSD